MFSTLNLFTRATASWKPVHKVYFLMGMSGMCAALFGADTGSIGAITAMPHFERQITPNGLSPILRGLIVSIMLMTSALSGLVSGQLSDRISRKYAIAIGCLVFSLGSLVCCLAPNLGVLMAARAFAGLGEGIFLGCSATYLSEVSPAHMRAKMMVFYQVILSLGLASAFFVCYGTVRIDSPLSWRLPFGLSAAIALFLAVAFPFLPFSPRYLVLKGRRDEAAAVIASLIGTESESQTERDELMKAGNAQKSTRFLDLFRKGYIGRTLLGVFLQITLQLSGIDFCLYYAPLLFEQAGLDATTSAFIASGATGLVILLTNLCALLWIDRIGRRAVHIFGGLAMAASLSIIGSIYASGSNSVAAGRWTIIAMIECYAIIFSGTWAYNVRLYTAEIQPDSTRASAVAFAVACNQAVNTVVALTAPDFLARSASGPYFCYGGFSLLSAIVGWLVMPETANKSLDRIDQDFQNGSVLVPKMLSRLRRNEFELRQRRPSVIRLDSSG